MKKTSKLFGAVALSAALAMGTALPAFAETVGVGTGAETSKDGVLSSTANGQVKATGENVVNLYGYDVNNQITASIPVSVTVAAPVAGGAIKAPDPALYTITNTGSVPIKVESVTGKAATGWKLVGGDLVDNTGKYTAAVDQNLNTINLKVFSGNTAPATVVEGTAAPLAGAEFALAAKAADGTTSSVELTLEGQAAPAGLTGGSNVSANSGASAKLFSETASKAVTLTYTVSNNDK